MLPTQVEMLQAVMRHAYGNGYHYTGRSHRWGYQKAQKVEEAIAAGEHQEVLLSEEFCRSFFTPRIRVNTSLTLPGTGLVYQTLPSPEEMATGWKRHHAHLQGEQDPILYCWRHLPR